jgi:hypothetical protein
MNFTGGMTLSGGMSIVVSGTAPVNTVAPVVSGTETFGSTLSTTDGTWTGNATITYTYQWQRGGGSYSNILGANSSTYTLVQADVNYRIRCVVTGTNSYGNSSANSNATNDIVPSVPGAPTVGTATATGQTTATVAFTAPVSNGGDTITSYTATSSPGGVTGTLNQAGSGTITVSGLTANTSYTFTVTATNIAGTGSASAASNSITTDPSVPAPALSYGWFAGGTYFSPGTGTIIYSTVDRITYATDTATASVRGPLSSNRYQAASAGTGYDGWVAGGNNAGNRTTVDRINYSTDTSTASIRGPLIAAGNFGMGAVSDNTTYGWYGAGSYRSSVQRIIYATDTATATYRGPLSQSKLILAAIGNTTDGWFGGGRDGDTGQDLSTVDRITYATDTATASVRGPLTINSEGLAAIGNLNYGWFGGGYMPGSGRVSTITRITYATDTVTSTNRGTFNSGISDSATSGDSTYGWFGGAYAPGPGATNRLSTVQRITYANDTGIASIRGPLSGPRVQMAGTGRQ